MKKNDWKILQIPPSLSINGKSKNEFDIPSASEDGREPSVFESRSHLADFWIYMDILKS